MMVRLGNFFFKFRNALFPFAYVCLFLKSPRIFADAYVALGLGLGVALAGQFLRAITIALVYIRRGGKNRQVYANTLVTEGMFSHCRNPLYVGNFLMILGLGLIANSIFFVGIIVPLFFFIYWAIISAEESFLRNKFGAQYDEYCSRVNRVVPVLTGFSETWRKNSFHWRRIVVKEYGTTFIFVGGAVLLIARNHYFYKAYSADAALPMLLGAVLAIDLICFAMARYAKKAELIKAD